MISVYDGEEAWVGHPSNFNWSALEGAQIVSHNAAFDRTVYREMVHRGWAPVVEYYSWECSANLAAFIAGADARDLKSASEIILGAAVAKDMRNWMRGRSWASVLATEPGRVERMLEYAKQDAIRCWQIWTTMLPHWPEQERKTALMTMDCTSYGVAVDVERLKQYLAATEEEKWRLEKDLPWIAEGEKAGSASALCDFCRRHKIPSPPLKKDDADGFDLWQTTYSPRFAWVGAVGQWRKVGKMLSFLRLVESRLRDEGNCYSVETPLKYAGAHTLRWSGDALNFQNMRKDPLMVGDVPVDARGLFIPRPGKALLVADYAQIEPRVLAWIAGDDAMLNLVRQGVSVYEAHARATMGWTGGVLKEENKELYKLAKARVLGLGYGCGWEKFIAVAASMAGMVLDKETAKTIVSDFRESNPKITALWSKLDNAIQRAYSKGEHLDMTLPSGREMHYLNIHRSSVVKNKIIENPENPEAAPQHERKTKFSFFAHYGGRRRSLYGALLTENLVQATARDVFMETLLKLNDAGLRTPFHTHDEFIIEVPVDMDDSGVIGELKKCPEWLAGCPIDVEAKRMERYAK
jgi:hypothetical protein